MEGEALQATLLINIRRSATIVILQVNIEVVLIMFAILIFVIDILKFLYSFIT